MPETPFASAAPSGETPSPSATAARGPMFTPKALLAGAAGMVWIVAGASLVDDAFKTSSYLTSNFFPFGVTAYLLALVLVWNPIWFGLAKAFGPRARRMAFGARELALVLGLSLCACWIPTSGLYRYFHRQNVLPWTQAMVTSPNWQTPLETLPAKLWPAGLDGRRPDAPPEARVMYERVYIDLVGGMSELERLPAREAFFAWPWRAWLGNLAYWGPLIVVFAGATIALMVTVHRQWAHHEQLAYPLAKIYQSLLDRDDRRLLPAVMRSRLFWGAFAGAFLFHAWNYGAQWYPDTFPRIATEWSFNTWPLFPNAHRAGASNFNAGALTFAVIGIAYFLSAEVGLTLGLAQFLLVFVSTQYYLAAGQPVMAEQWDATRFGGYFAYTLILLYAGRTWYWRIVRKAFGVGRPDAVDGVSVWAARMFVLAFAASWGLLCVMEMDPALAFAYLVFLYAGLLVFTRLICETGLPFMQMGALFVPFIRLIGYPAVGVRGAVYVGHLAQILASDTREALQPYVATSLYVGERAGGRMPRFAWALAAALAAALAFGFWVRGYGFYRYGSSTDVHANTAVPRAMMAESLMIVQKASVGKMPAESPAGLDRLLSVRPESGTVAPVLVGAGVTAAMAALRFRFSWFMLHPLLLLVWGTYPMQRTAQCFLIGWIVKSLVLQFGGGRVYQRGKPLFIGMITGEAAVMGVSLLAGVAYYFVMGTNPQVLRVYPG